MRFSRGNRVEVLVKKKVPTGVWRSAEIMADNTHSYTVRFCRRPGVSKEVIEKVLVEDVRPCPPPVVSPSIWIVGDIVEVLDDYYWKPARIEEVLGDGFYHVHLIGSIDEFRVEKSSIRAQQVWKDNNKWIQTGKDSAKGMMARVLKKTHVRKEGNSNNLLKLESVLQSKPLMRKSPDSSSPGEVVDQNVLKRRVVAGDVLSFIPPDSYSFTGKDMWRHVSLAATCLKMMVWLATFSLVSRKGHHLHSLCRQGIHV